MAKRQIAVVAAAGNHAATRPFWPAAFEPVLAVGAVEEDAGSWWRASYSNHGPWVDVTARGSNLQSTFTREETLVAQGATPAPATDPTISFDGWAAWDGTSFATPIAAAMLARTMTRYSIAAAVDAESTLLTAASRRARRLPERGAARRARGRAGVRPSGAAVDHLQVVLPVARRFCELPLAHERVVGHGGREALGERGMVAPEAQHPVLERRAVGPAHAARVEVLLDEPLAVLGSTDDGDRVREQLVLVAGALDEELAALQPLEGDLARNDGVELRMGRLGGPRADERVVRREAGISVGHVPRTIARRGTHR